MKYIAYLTALLICTGCAHSTFSPPSTLYSDSNSIGVRYYSRTGIITNSKSEEALKLVADHCNGKYKITNRNEVDDWTTIDAECEQP